MSILITLGALIGYGYVGLWWARTQAISIQKRLKHAEEYYLKHYDRWSCSQRTDEPWFGFGVRWRNRAAELRFALGVHAALWPVVIPAKAVGWICRNFVNLTLGFATKPITDQIAKTRELRDEAETLKNARLLMKPGEADFNRLSDAIHGLENQAKELDLL